MAPVEIKPPYKGGSGVYPAFPINHPTGETRNPYPPNPGSEYGLSGYITQWKVRKIDASIAAIAMSAISGEHEQILVPVFVPHIRGDRLDAYRDALRNIFPSLSLQYDPSELVHTKSYSEVTVIDKDAPSDPLVRVNIPNPMRYQLTVSGRVDPDKLEAIKQATEVLLQPIEEERKSGQKLEEIVVNTDVPVR